MTTAAHPMIAGRPLILDVRTPEEFAQGHLCGAVLIPTPLPPLSRSDWYVLLDHLIYETVDLSKWWPIYVYCKKGVRSTVAVDILRYVREYQNVYNLGGVETEPLKGWVERQEVPWCYGVGHQRSSFMPRLRAA